VSVDDILRSYEFFDIWMEFDAIDHYLDLVETDLPSIIEVERKNITAQFNADDEEDQQTAGFLEDELDAGITTRFFEGGAYLAVWAAYERGLHKVAALLAKEKHVLIRPEDLKGPTLSAVRKYFDKVLGFSLHLDGTDWERIEMIYRLRNCLAHENGRLLSYSSQKAKDLERWIVAQGGAQVIDGYVVLTGTFVRATLKFLQGLVDDLTKRVQMALGGPA